MKIIKNGNVPKYVAECGVCGCVFQFGHDEMIKKRRDLLLFTVESRSMKCPYCGSDVDEWEDSE